MTEEKLMQKLGDEIESQMNEETDQAATEFPASPELKEKLAALMIATDKEHEQKQRKACRKKAVQGCAVFLLCVIAVSVTFPQTVGAVKKHIFHITADEDEGAISFASDEQMEKLKEWSGYWYPEYLPEGYELAYVDDKVGKVLSFVSKTTDSMISIRLNDQPINFSYDKTYAQATEVSINNYQGYVFSDKEDSSVTLLLNTSDDVIQIKMSNTTETGVIIKIAKRLKFIK